MGYSKKGWIIRTALAKARFIAEYGGDLPSDGDPRTELEARAIIESRLNFFDIQWPNPEDNAEPDEVIWVFSQRDRSKLQVGTWLRYLAPSPNAVRRMRAEGAEQARIAKAARAERREILRACVGGRSGGGASKPRLGGSRL